MPKIVNFLGGLLTSSIIIFFTALPTLATEGDILFFDDFNDGNLNGWTVESGNWYVNNGNLVGYKSGRAFWGKVYTGSSEWDNYRLEVDVNGVQGIDQSIGFRYTQNGYYEINLRYGTGMYDTPQVKLWKATENENRVMIADTQVFPLRNNSWYHVKIETLNENIKVWIENTLIFDFTDTGTNIKKGTIMLAYWTGDISVAYMRFDNVKVTALAPPPSPKTPLILIPGIGGSELKVNEDTIWNKDDGHGGTFSHIYPVGEKVWVNEGAAAEPGEDDYFDVLRMKADGISSEANIGLTRNLLARAYGDTIEFFTSNEASYTLNEDFFVFPYDWRLDNTLSINKLEEKIQEVKDQTGSEKVDIIAHSMGGLIARAYISDPTKAQSVRKLFTLGTPYLGAVKFLQAIRYGICFVGIGSICPILAPSEVQDVIQNMISGFQLAPSQAYFNFYSDESNSYPYPYRTETGSLSYIQTKDLLTGFGHNTALFAPAESFHIFDNSLNNTNDVDVTIIAGSGQPTIGQIIELKTISLLGKENTKRYARIINGDKTVPLFSASLDDPSRNLSLLGSAKLYYTNQKHDDLVINGSALNLIRNTLNGLDELPEGVSTSPYTLPLIYQILSVHSPVNIHVYDASGNHTGPTSNGDFEVNIPGSSYDTLGDAKFIYLPENGVYDVKFEVTDNGSFDFKIRKFEDDQNTETILYKEIPLTENTKAEATFDTQSSQTPTIKVDENGDGTFDFNAEHFSILEGDANYDYTPPSISFDVNPKTIWPPNNKMVDINITGTITDDNPYLTTILIDDEYNLVEPKVTIENQTNINQVIKLEASRKGDDNDGRKYVIKILATDLAGNTSVATFEILVPHDQGKKK